MCLDIDPGSVIHKHLVKKLTNLSSIKLKYVSSRRGKVFDEHNPVIRNEKDTVSVTSIHNLTMLYSFHISLGEPPSHVDLMVTDDKAKVHKELRREVNDNNKKICHLDIMPIIGDITLAPIVISEKDNKKSAWIPLHPYWLDQILSNNDVNVDKFDSFDHRCDECPVQHLHVSVANLTGEPHDSIARPEDCIIDTITE